MVNSMELTSSVFANEEKIPEKYGCEGDGVSPPLKISGAPEGTKSLALIMYDVDVPEEFKKKLNIDGWDHWQVWNIKPDTTEIDENSVPEGAIQGKQTGGDLGYTGPCPPKDKEPPKHRYFFWLYALDVEKLDLEEGASKADVEKAMEGHVLEKAELMGVYEKKE